MPPEPRRDLIRERLIDYFKPKVGKFGVPKRMITDSLSRRLFLEGNWIQDGSRIDTRQLHQIDDIFYRASLRSHRKYVSLSDLIKGYLASGVKRVNVLDVGAGEGNVSDQLNLLFGNKIKYEGVDLQPREKKAVKQLDVVSEKLPFETYHLIFGVYSFQYMTDKFRALENMVNALKPGGTLKLVSSDSLLNGILMKRGAVVDYLDPKFLKEIIERINPFLTVEISQFELKIVKKSSGKVNLPFRYLGYRMNNADLVYRKLESNVINGYFAGTSYYQFEKSRQTKW